MHEIVYLIHSGDLEKALWKTVNIIEHDIACWKEVLRKAADNDVVRAMADGRIKSLELDADKIYEALLDKQKTDQREAMKQVNHTPENHPPNNWDYTKRIRRKGHGWKANHES